MTKISIIACATVLVTLSLCINGHPLFRSPNQSRNIAQSVDAKHKMAKALDNLMSSDYKVKRKLGSEYVDKLKEELENLGFDSDLLDDDDVLEELTTTQAAPVLCDEKKGEFPFLFGCVQG